MKRYLAFFRQGRLIPLEWTKELVHQFERTVRMEGGDFRAGFYVFALSHRIVTEDTAVIVLPGDSLSATNIASNGQKIGA